jgi:Golgi nucleoside diphosphatase
MKSVLHLQASTKIKLGATAGLRLLPEGKADIILDEVRKFLKQYPFQLDDKTGVTILDGARLDVHRFLPV